MAFSFKSLTLESICILSVESGVLYLAQQSWSLAEESKNSDRVEFTAEDQFQPPKNFPQVSIKNRGINSEKIQKKSELIFQLTKDSRKLYSASQLDLTNNLPTSLTKIGSQVIAKDSGSPNLRRTPLEDEQLFEPKRIPLRIPVNQPNYQASPSITIINPSGYGASWGNAGIGVGFQERTRFTSEADGVIGLGFGLGNPQKNLGVQLGVSLVDVSAPFRDGAFNLKVHRRLPNDFSAAIGVQGLATWGVTDGGSSVFGVTTKRFVLQEDKSKLFSEVYASVGIGGGQFRSESDINDGVESVGLFGSIAVRVIEPMSVVAEWTGQDLTIGVPFVPFKRLPLVVVPSVTDITGEAGDGARFIIGAGYNFSF